jgi:Na+/H+ antiporter NhaC
LLLSDELEWNGRTSIVLLILFFLVFVFIDFGFYVKEAADCRAFVTSLATVLV